MTALPPVLRTLRRHLGALLGGFFLEQARHLFPAERAQVERGMNGATFAAAAALCVGTEGARDAEIGFLGKLVPEFPYLTVELVAAALAVPGNPFQIRFRQLVAVLVVSLAGRMRCGTPAGT